MNRVNYQKELDKILEALEKEYAGSAAVKSNADEQHGAKAQRSPAERRGPDERCGRVSGPDFAPVRKKLLLHSCCAPCSSYVLEYLSRYFDITVFYYNPNITQRGEYDRRVEEQGRLIRLMNEEKERTSPGMMPSGSSNSVLSPVTMWTSRFLSTTKSQSRLPRRSTRSISPWVHTQSSPSTTRKYLPRACCNAALMVDPWPPFSLEMTLKIDGERLTKDSAMRAVASVEPSSTTMTSNPLSSLGEQ